MEDQDRYVPLRQGAIEIIQGWEAAFSSASGQITLNAEPRGQRKPLRLDHRVTTFLLGFAAEVVTLSGTIIELLDKKRSVEALPLIRVSYEAAITGQWVSGLGVDAAKALVNEYARQRRALRHDLQRVPSNLASYAEEIAGIEMEDLETASGAQARNLRQLMDDFQYGKEMYIYYRLMSEYSHAGVSAVDLFFKKAPTETELPTFTYEPNQPDRALWGFFTLMCLCQAVHPVARLLSDRSLVRTIETLAGQHNIRVRLNRSGHYFERMQKYREDQSRRSS
jgi:hypothetical protein